MKASSMLDFIAYLTLFAVSFVAATLYPLGSEAFVIGYVLGDYSPLMVFIVATLGNALGSISTYALAFLGESYILERYFSSALAKLEKFSINFRRFGAVYAFFTFLPIVGDIFALGLGISRYPFIKAIIFITLGKAVRYAILVIATLYFRA